MFTVSMMCFVLGLVSFMRDSVTWQMPLWASVALTAVGAIGMLISRRKLYSPDRIQKNRSF